MVEKVSSRKTEAKRKKTRTKTAKVPKACAEPNVPVRDLSPDVNPHRAALIRNAEKKWVNGTNLRYCFLNSPTRFRGSVADRQKAKAGFAAWENVGIGITFQEVPDPEEAEIRIAFQKHDGHWSYVGRDVLGIGQFQPTMNLDPTDGLPVDTAIHEIGHTLGFPHEHQNPNAGIEWDEEAVYADLAGDPNFWSREQTFHNIIRKLDPGTVQGSAWDKDSIMHYRFKKGLIRKPEIYQNQALIPDGGLSPTDVREVRSFYPALAANIPDELKPFQSKRLSLNPRDQVTFRIKPTATRRYTLGTFGGADTVMVLFENTDNGFRFIAGDDDSGESRNAQLSQRLIKGRTYELRTRLYYQDAKGELALMIW